MIIQELKAIDSSPKEIRKFAMVVGIVLLGIGGFLLYKKSGVFPYFLYSGGGLILIGLILPIVLLPLQKVWMGIAVILGFVVTHLILSFLYFFSSKPTWNRCKAFW